MVTCFFYIELKTKDANVTLERVEELPFYPSVGQRFIFNDVENEFSDADRVEYSFENEAFWVTDFRSHGYDCSCTPANACCVFNAEHWSGWTIHDGPRYGEDRGMLEKWQFPNDA